MDTGEDNDSSDSHSDLLRFSSNLHSNPTPWRRRGNQVGINGEGSLLKLILLSGNLLLLIIYYSTGRRPHLRNSLMKLF